jgi:protocatechuate 3,4-dioxygenase beta subunit
MEDKKPVVNSSRATPRTQEGPYYQAGSPETSRLYTKGVPGIRFMLTGFVYDAAGHPISGAWLDFWQADGNGTYDNSGYVLRGHQYTDQSGKYSLDTVLPGSYPGRTPHIHVKVRAKNDSPVMTTQLFIPGKASNKSDFVYQDALQMDIREVDGVFQGTFNFKLGN